MASEEDVKNESCVYDPDFAVVCSFFENFSSLCGIQPPSISELQQMLEDTQFTAPQLIDLHIRLMRKAKKNVNPDRWQKTLAKFCYYSLPDDCWTLEQKGYQSLNYSQRLKFLLTLIGAQFDLNAKFKSDINKLDVRDLRLQPVGRDKYGNNYWAHMDQETTLKVYKEDLDEEKWELVVQDREGLAKLIDDLIKDKDPNRKLEELAEESESSAEEEEPLPEPEAKTEMKDENVEKEKEKETEPDEGIKKDSKESNAEGKEPSKKDPAARFVPKPAVKDERRQSHFAEKLQQAYNEGPLNKASLSLISRPRSSNTATPIKPLDKKAFTQHLQKLDSINMLKPLLTSTEPGDELNPATVRSDLLKAKINQKFSIIKPGLQTDIAKSKLEPPTKPAKPGLKLEQILKSKLAQKLSGASTLEVASTSEGDEGDKKTEDKKPVTEPCKDPIEKSVATESCKDSVAKPVVTEQRKDLVEEAVEKPSERGEVKRVLDSSADSEEQPAKKCRTEESAEDGREIEEPVMVVNGVGDGRDCDSCNNEDDEIEESVMFFYGVGSGAECATGNNENDDTSKNSSHTVHLTHKVDNMLKPTSESETTTPSTSACETIDTEKKKPKLWTIDAICNSDSSKDSKRDNVSQFPNFSFNKDTKPYHSASESYSIFSLTESKDSRDAASVIPTNFYFGSNNQNPCFLPAELSPTFKGGLHSVENIVEGINKMADVKASKFSAENLYSKTNNVNDVDKVVRMPEADCNEAPEIASADETNLAEASETVDSSATREPALFGVQLESKIIDRSTPRPDEEVVVTKPDASSDDTERSEDVTAEEAPAPVEEHHSDSAREEISPLPPSPASSTAVQISSPIKEIESVPTSISNSEEESEALTPDELNGVPDASQSNLAEELESVTADQEKHVHVQEAAPSEVVADNSVVDGVQTETEIVAPEVEPSSAAVESSEPIKITETAPILPSNENTHSEPEVPDLAAEVVGSIDEPKDEIPSHQTLENPSASVREEKEPDNPQLDAALPEAEIRPSELREESENVSKESATNETTNQVIESVAEEPVPSAETSLPAAVDEATAKQTETVGTVSTEIETHKTDDSERKVTDSEVETAEKIEKTEPKKQLGRSTRGQTRQLSKEADEEESVLLEEKAQIGPQTEKKAQVTRKRKRDSTDVVKDDQQAQQTLPNETTVESETAGTSLPVQKETKKGKQKEASNVPVPPVPENDAPKKDESETDDGAKTRRTTRSSRARKSEVEIVNQSAEKGKKSSKSSKEKNDVEVNSENVDRTKKSSKIVKPKNEKDDAEVAGENVDKVKKPSKSVKQKNEKNDVDVTNEGVGTPKKSLRNSKQKNENVDIANEITGKAAKKVSKNVKQKNEPEKVEALKITIRTTRNKSNDDEKEVVTMKTSPVKIKDDEAESKTETDEQEVEETAENNEDAGEVASDNDQAPKLETKKPAKKGGKRKKRSYGKKTAKSKTPKKVNKVEENQSEGESAAKDAAESQQNEKDETPKKETPEPKKKRLKRGWLNEVDVSNIASTPETETPGIRQSRRIAQLKIKEQSETKYQEVVTPTKKVPANQKSKNSTPTKKNKAGKGKYKPPKEDSDEEIYYELPSSKKKRKKKRDQPPKKDFDPKKPWKQSSESSSEEEDEEDHFEEEDEEFTVIDKSDHEFSPESDMEDEDYQPIKRARTAHSKPRAEDKSERDDLACQSCGTADQPEWILLCDSCDEGWHAACLKPPVMAIPEGEWFCPPCQHNKLINGLQMFLRTYDKAVKKRASEESRRKRLEYVNISFSNVIQEESAPKQKAARAQASSSSDESSDEESEEDEEPLYQLRVRRQANVRHRLNEYEELMSNAIERENGDVPLPVGSVKPEASVNSAVEVVQNNVPAPTQTPEANVEDKKDSEDSAEDEEEEEEEEEGEEKGEEKAKEVPIILQLRNVRKKPARLTNLDVSSEDDHYSDEDFKGSSADDPDEDEEYAKSETDSDEAAYRRGRGRREPVRRSTRARRTRYDNDFINDDSDEDDEDDEEYGRKKKKKRISYAESDSDEDSTWGRKKRKKNTQTFKAKPAKRRRRIRFDGDSDEDEGKKKNNRNSRIKYGLDEDEDFSSTRRTRGKKINYQDDMDSEFEEEEESTRPKNKSRKILSDDEYMDEDDDQKDSAASENGEHSESGSESNESGDVQKSKKAQILESDDSNSAPAPASEPQEAKALEPPSKTVVSAEPDRMNETTGSANPVITTDIEQKKSVIHNSVNDSPEALAQKINQNPSLQGMQSMAHNLSHPPPPNQFPPTVHPDAAAAFIGRHPQQGPVPVHYELGIRYETPEGVPLPPPLPQPADKFPHPIRVPSPNKMYALPPDMQAANRPHLPPFPPQQMQPPIIGPPGIIPVASLPPSSRPMPPAIPISQMPMSLPRPESGRPMPTAIPISQGPMTMPDSGRPMPPAIPISQVQITMPPGPDRPMPSAIPIGRGPISMPGPGPPSMHARPPHLVGPPPNVNIAQCGPPPPGSMIPPNAMPPTTPDAPPKRRPRGRGKKQLEMERLQREREAMEANRNEDMIPLHVLKMPPPEANAAATAHSTMVPPPPPPRPPFSTYQQIPFSQAPSPVQQQAGSAASKRVKITPTRMRMPTPPDKIVHIPRSPNSPAAGMYPSARHPPVPVSSPSPGTPSPDGKGAGPPPSVSGAGPPPTTPTLPVKTEAGGPIRPESSADVQYYHHPPTPYPPSQGPRVYGSRPEYPFARKPAPPGMYPSPLPPPPPTSNTAPNVVVSRTGGFAGAVGPPPVSSPNIKTESPTSAAAATNTGPTVPQPYPGQYGMPPRGLPTTVVSSSVACKPGQSGPYIMSTRPLPPGPPPAGYPVHPHIKALPPHSNAGAPPYAAPYYGPRPPYSSASAPPPLQQQQQPPPPPQTSQPSVTFSHTMPTPNFSPNQSAAAVASRIAPPPSHSPVSSGGGDTNAQLNSLPPTSQSGDYQFSPPPTRAPSETETAPSEESAPAEESSGEFGGLVSYFSSQHEDDLDA